MNKHHCRPASHTVQHRPWILGLPPLLLWGWGWGSGEDWIKGHSSDSSSLVIIGDWEGREGKRGKRQWNPVDKLSTTLPQILLTPLPKNSLAEDTFNNSFLFLKKYSDKPSICPSPCLALGLWQPQGWGAKCCWPAPVQTEPWQAGCGLPAPPDC